MNYTNVSLHTFGFELPPNRLTSAAVEERLAPVYQRLGLPAGRLELMSGICERRLWNPGTRPSEAAALAGKKVLARAAVDPQQVEALFFTSVCRDMMEPATASFVHHALGLSADALVLDISNACLGFLDGMVMLAAMIESGQVRNGLIVSGETAEDLVESTLTSLIEDQTITRKTIKPAFASLTIGSGAVGLLMTRSGDAPGAPRLLRSAWHARTRFSTLCQGGAGQGGTLMATDSEELLHQGVATAEKTWEKFSKEPAWRETEIDRFFCHQVGSAHARLLFESLGLGVEKNFQTLSFLGNTGSVSAPITMAIGIEEGVFTRGEKAAILGIGSGIHCMMLGVEW